MTESVSCDYARVAVKGYQLVAGQKYWQNTMTISRRSHLFRRNTAQSSLQHSRVVKKFPVICRRFNLKWKAGRKDYLQSFSI